MSETPVVWPDRFTPPAEGELDAIGCSTVRRCPLCRSPLYWSSGMLGSSFICLNACHLGEDAARRFREALAAAEARLAEEDA